MVDVSQVGKNEYINIQLVSNLMDKRYVVLGEGWLAEFKDRNGVEKSKLVIPVELVEGNQHLFWVLNEDSLQLWKIKWGSETGSWVGKAGLFKVSSSGGFPCVIGEPLTNITAPLMR
jgi:hypothetical protein